MKIQNFLEKAAIFDYCKNAKFLSFHLIFRSSCIYTQRSISAHIPQSFSFPVFPEIEIELPSFGIIRWQV
jgi:hypothetical protein